MPDIQAFRGYRYDLGHVGSLSDVVAPPYDVIDEQLAGRAVQTSSGELRATDPQPSGTGRRRPANRYSRAARLWKNWTSEGVLRQEADPASTCTTRRSSTRGSRLVRRGMLCAVRLERFRRGKHLSRTKRRTPGPKADRLRLLGRCGVKLSPIFGVYPDPENVCQDLLEAAVAGQIPLEAATDEGVVHRLWPVTDVKVIAGRSRPPWPAAPCS